MEQLKCIIDYEKLRAVAHAVFKEMKDHPEKRKKVSRIRARIIQDYYKMVETPPTTENPQGLNFYSDEAKERGGTEKAPTPLQYFLAGLALCELSFYARNASIMRLTIDSIDIEVQGEMDWLDRMRVMKYVDQKDEQAERVSSGFHRINTHVRIQSHEPADKIMRLIQSVEELCTAYNTITHSVPIETKIELNGRPMDPSYHH
ncbi:MAG: OsmC family protein [Thaumarchaeota archaeon]|nr:OsmC family protein [Nitrososphaerota archaeon]